MPITADLTNIGSGTEQEATDQRGAWDDESSAGNSYKATAVASEVHKAAEAGRDLTCPSQPPLETSRPINPNRIFSFALVSENSIHERLNHLGVESS